MKAIRREEKLAGVEQRRLAGEDHAPARPDFPFAS
jgi:hypothetical protein